MYIYVYICIIYIYISIYKLYNLYNSFRRMMHGPKDESV